jgi:hypothetical protein
MTGRVLWIALSCTVVLQTVPARAQDAGPALAPYPQDVKEATTAGKEVDGGEDEPGDHDPCAWITCSGHGRCVVEKVEFSDGSFHQRRRCKCDPGYMPGGAQGWSCLPASKPTGDIDKLKKKYQTHSIAGNVLSDTSLALLLASQASFVLLVMTGFAGGACDEEESHCTAEERSLGSWIAFLSAGASSFAAGFPLLYSAQVAGDQIAPQMQHLSRRIRPLQTAAWTFYALSMANITAGVITMPFEATQWISGLVFTPIALAFAMVAVGLNFHAWRLVHRNVRDQLSEPTTSQATLLPMLSPAHGGMIAGLRGVF